MNDAKQKLIIMLMFRSVILYHSRPTLLSEEITMKDAENIIRSCQRNLWSTQLEFLKVL